MYHTFFYNRKFIVSMLLVFLNLVFNGCYSQREVASTNNQLTKIYKIEMLDGKIIDFKDNEVGYASLYKDKIVSVEKNGEINTYQVSKIKKLYTEKFDYVKTIFLGLGSVAALFVALLVVIVIGMEGRGFGG